MHMEPQIDYTKVDPVPFRKTLAHVNYFVVQTTQFLNRFSYICEQRLNGVSRHLLRLEITMNILEAKLNSIPNLDGSGANATTAATGNNTPAPASTHDDELPPPPPPRDEEYAHNSYEQETYPSGDNSGGGGGGGGMMVKDDPRYSQYFTMLRLRVPVAAIKQKMMLEGINPDILDNPEAPSDWSGSVEGAQQPQQGGGSAEKFSDDEEEEEEEEW